jgi:hypothetical protein
MEMQLVRYFLALGEEQHFTRCKALRRGAEEFRLKASARDKWRRMKSWVVVNIAILEQQR